MDHDISTIRILVKAALRKQLMTEPQAQMLIIHLQGGSLESFSGNTRSESDIGQELDHAKRILEILIQELESGSERP